MLQRRFAEGLQVRLNIGKQFLNYQLPVPKNRIDSLAHVNFRGNPTILT